MGMDSIQHPHVNVYIYETIKRQNDTYETIHSF